MQLVNKLNQVNLVLEQFQQDQFIQTLQSISKKKPREDESFQSWKDSISIVPESLKYCLINTYQGVSPILTKQLEVVSNTGDSEIMEKNIDFISDSDLKEIFKNWKIWINRF